MYTAQRYDKASKALESAISHETLPKRKTFNYLRLWMKPSFTPWVSWTVFQDVKTDEWFVRRIVWSPADPDIAAGITTYAAEAPLTENFAQQLHGSLSKLDLSPFPDDNSFGLDGVFFGVDKKDSLTGCSIAWWCSPPEGLKTLGKWLANASKAVESALPATTLPLDEIKF